MLAALGTLVIFGRMADVPWLVRLGPEFVPMAFPTAVGFLLAGAAFVAEARGARRWARGGAAALLLFGSGILLLYLAAQAWHIDAFYYDPERFVPSRGVGFDGRMSPNVAGAFAILGLALLGLELPRPRLAGVTAAGIVLGVLALLALASYASGLRWAQSWWRYTGMAVHTAAGVGLMGTALIAAVVRRVRASDPALARTLPLFAIAGALVVVVPMLSLVANEHREKVAARAAVFRLHRGQRAR